MANPSLLILAGDGIGPEVMAEVKKIIGWMGAKRGIRLRRQRGSGRRLRL
jgi:3-isopropylmalate dehydrogenase